MNDNPHEYGHGIAYGPGIIATTPSGRHCLHADVRIERDDAIRFLIAMAGEVLPPATRFEIREKVHSPISNRGLAFYAHPDMAADKTWDSWQPGLDASDGFVLVSRHVSPAEPEQSPR